MAEGRGDVLVAPAGVEGGRGLGGEASAAAVDVEHAAKGEEEDEDDDGDEDCEEDCVVCGGGAFVECGRLECGVDGDRLCRRDG